MRRAARGGGRRSDGGRPRVRRAAPAFVCSADAALPHLHPHDAVGVVDVEARDNDEILKESDSTALVQMIVWTMVHLTIYRQCKILGGNPLGIYVWSFMTQTSVTTGNQC
jgi:hypothetical protein